MYAPRELLRSTSRRIASQILGASCHSAIRRGFSPSSSDEGFTPAMYWYVSLRSGSWRWIVLEDICSAIVVLPHRFGPMMSSAPVDERRLLKYPSATLGLYSLITIAYMKSWIYMQLLSEHRG